MNADIASMNASLGCHHECSAKISTEDAFSGYLMIILGALMVTVVIVIVLGNALVIFSFKVDRSLRRQSNYYFLNLAISDFLVGAVCIPLYIPYILTGRWTLGRGVCKLWLLLDYLLCTASVFSIVLISYDRFLSVTKALLPLGLGFLQHSGKVLGSRLEDPSSLISPPLSVIHLCHLIRASF